jgi:outer membrane biosynthesis protein TonB
MVDKQSALGGTKTFDRFISANIRTISNNGVVEGRSASLNHELAPEHKPTDQQSSPPDEKKPEEPTQHPEEEKTEQKPEEKPPEPPPAPLTWRQRLKNWWGERVNAVKGFFSRLFGE